jgi:hypothetical protein
LLYASFARNPQPVPRYPQLATRTFLESFHLIRKIIFQDTFSIDVSRRTVQTAAKGGYLK